MGLWEGLLRNFVERVGFFKDAKRDAEVGGEEGGVGSDVGHPSVVFSALRARARARSMVLLALLICKEDIIES